MKRILIFGNSGSGKSWLSQKISKKSNLMEVNLDSIFWEPGGFSKKRSEEEVNKEILILQKTDSWVIEGVFGGLIELLIPFATQIVFLDIPWGECKTNLLARGSESSKQLDEKQAEIKFKELLEWASKYNQRESKNSYFFHDNLFMNFKSEKHRLTTRNEIGFYLTSNS